jgi:regulator of protease activity HflC (stomatin/prohibitin superfamily)
MLMQALIAKRQAQAEAQREQQAADEARAEQERRAAINQHAGHLIADGHCSEARAYALNEGDFELAHQVDSLCAAPGPTPPAPH